MAAAPFKPFSIVLKIIKNPPKVSARRAVKVYMKEIDAFFNYVHVKPKVLRRLAVTGSGSVEAAPIAVDNICHSWMKVATF